MNQINQYDLPIAKVFFNQMISDGFYWGVLQTASYSDSKWSFPNGFSEDEKTELKSFLESTHKLIGIKFPGSDVIRRLERNESIEFVKNVTVTEKNGSYLDDFVHATLFHPTYSGGFGVIHSKLNYVTIECWDDVPKTCSSLTKTVNNVFVSLPSIGTEKKW